jgi:hypothetical protein
MWPLANVVDPKKMARSGFFFTGSGNTVQCVFCRGAFNNFVANHDPDELHYIVFRNCAFVHNLPVGNIPYNHETGQELRSDLADGVHLDVCRIPNCIVHNFKDEGFVDDYNSSDE